MGTKSKIKLRLLPVFPQDKIPSLQKKLMAPLRNVFRKKQYYVGKIPTWEDPPPFPSMGIFFDKIPFFLKMSQSERL